MTKKHLLSIPVVFCVFICTMCTDAISPLLQKQKNNRFISLSEAKANVLDLLRIIDTKTTKGASNSRQIANCFSLGFGTKGSNGGLIYHVINFADNKGYALASADRRTMPVFCVIDEGQFSGFDKIDNPSFKAILKSIDIYYHLKTGAKVFDTNGNEVPKEVLVRRFGDVIDEEVTRRRRVRYNYQSTDYTEVYQEDRVIHMNIGAYGYANGYYYPDYLNIGMGPIILEMTLLS